MFLKNWQASKYSTKISAVDGYKTTEDKDIAGTLNQYYNSAVNCIEITENKSFLTGTKTLEDLVEISFEKLENHEVF